MIEVELWEDIGGDPRTSIVYRWLWTLTVDGNAFELRGDAERLDPSLRLINLYEAPDFRGRVPESLTFWDNPEMWARTLWTSHRNGYTVARIVHDDNPPPELDEPEFDDDGPIVVQPPANTQLAALIEAQDADILDGTGSEETQALLLDPVVAYFSCDELVERAREATTTERRNSPVVLRGVTAQITLGQGLLPNLDIF